MCVFSSNRPCQLATKNCCAILLYSNLIVVSTTTTNTDVVTFQRFRFLRGNCEISRQSWNITWFLSCWLMVIWVNWLIRFERVVSTRCENVTPARSSRYLSGKVSHLKLPALFWVYFFTKQNIFFITLCELWGKAAEARNLSHFLCQNYSEFTKWNLKSFPHVAPAQSLPQQVKPHNRD